MKALYCLAGEVLVRTPVEVGRGQDVEHALFTGADDADVEPEPFHQLVGEKAVARSATDQEGRPVAERLAHPAEKGLVVRDMAVAGHVDGVDVADRESDDVPRFGDPGQILDGRGVLDEVDQPGLVARVIEGILHTPQADGEDRFIARHGETGQIDEGDAGHLRSSGIPLRGTIR